MAERVCVERALFIIGDQNTGKSTQLRSIFCDWRLGKKGKKPTADNLRETYPLSNERGLYLRLTSPHEAGENVDEFLDKCDKAMQPKRGQLARRWNFAGALQPSGSETQVLSESAAEVIAAFVGRFAPERVRTVILSPNKDGCVMLDKELLGLIAKLRKVRKIKVEVMIADATAEKENGLIYADFFDFT